MNSFMITQNPSPKTQQEVHDFYIQHCTLVVTQQEYCKSGQQHHHIYVNTFLTKQEVVTICNHFNPPLSEYTNRVDQANTFGGAMKYLFKEAKRCQPLLYGVSEQACKTAINKYKNASRTNLRKQKASTDIDNTIMSSVDLQTRLDRLHKEQRAIVEISLQKSVSLMQLYRDIEDFDALQEEKAHFDQLIDERRKLLTADEIFKIHTEFANIYIPPSYYNGQIPS